MGECLISAVFFSLGSNLGDRPDFLKEACYYLKQISQGRKLLKVSPIIETNPMYVTDQPSFLNQVVLLETFKNPFEVLFFIKEVERLLGRKITQRYGPRVIDIDIVFFGDYAIQTPLLTIPHPLHNERDFVLSPLMQISPFWMNEKDKKIN